MAEEPKKGTDFAKLAALKKRWESARSKTPSTVVEAFLPEPIVIGDRELLPIDTRVWLRLEKIKSPLLPGITDREPVLEDFFRAFYILTTDPEESRKVIAGGSWNDRGEYSNAALEAAVDSAIAGMPIELMPMVAEKILEHIAREFAPNAEMEASQEGSGSGPLVKAPATEPAAS